MWWRRWPPFLFWNQRGRTPQWRRSPRSQQQAAQRTARRKLEGEEEAWTQWQQQTAGVPHADASGPGQDGDWVVLQPFLLWSQGKEMPGSLHLVGKLGGPGRLNAVAAGQLIHMLDQISNRRFLVDTSASYSFLPHRSSLPATTLLGRPPGAASIPGSGFFLEISIGRCSFSYFGRGFFESPQTADLS